MQDILCKRLLFTSLSSDGVLLDAVPTWAVTAVRGADRLRQVQSLQARHCPCALLHQCGRYLSTAACALYQVSKLTGTTNTEKSVFHANHFCFLTYKTMMILKLFAVKKHGHVRNSGKKLGLVKQQKITWRTVCCLWQMRWNELSVPDLFHFLSPLILLEKAVMGRIITLFKNTSFKYLWGAADKSSIQTLQAHTCPCSMWKQPLKQLFFLILSLFVSSRTACCRHIFTNISTWSTRLCNTLWVCT